jgi:transcriptional regulator with XRE-family HTH domain
MSLVHFATNLRTCRRLRGLTQAALAERAGLHQIQISRLELGYRPIPKQIAALARALRVSVDMLLRRPVRMSRGQLSALKPFTVETPRAH